MNTIDISIYIPFKHCYYFGIRRTQWFHVFSSKLWLWPKRCLTAQIIIVTCAMWCADTAAGVIGIAITFWLLYKPGFFRHEPVTWVFMQFELDYLSAIDLALLFGEICEFMVGTPCSKSNTCGVRWNLWILSTFFSGMGMGTNRMPHMLNSQSLFRVLLYILA